MTVRKKSCTKCLVVKPASGFQNRPSVKSGLASWCRKCTEKLINSTGIVRRTAAKKRLMAIRGGKCEKCHGVFPHFCYDFHHIDPSKKERKMTDLHAMKWSRVLKEAKKCLMLCANCHRILHHSKPE